MSVARSFNFAVTDDPRADGQLLTAFLDSQDERAFAHLMGRHARIVWGICRCTLGHTQDAEDAFQATFLVLARRGRELTGHPSVGGWLYSVAGRVANKARIQAVRRSRLGRHAVRPEGVHPSVPDADLPAILDEEIGRLDERERLPVLLCDVEGLPRAAAAARLGWTEGCLSGRLHRARRQLADRLRVRGVVPVAGAAVALGGATATARLTAATLATVRAVTIHEFPPGGTSASVADLARGVQWEMTMRTVKRVLLASVAAAVVATGGGLLGMRWEAAQAAPVPKERVAAEEQTLTPAMADLTSRADVRQELKCTPEQSATLEDHFHHVMIDQARRMVLKNRGVVVDLKGSPDGPPPPTCGVVEKVLSAGQVARLAQIELQARGLKTLIDPKVEKALRLTDDQKKVVREALVPREAPAVKEGKSAVEDLSDLVQKVTAKEGEVTARQAAFREVLDGLTKDQAEAWKKLTGEPWPAPKR